MSVVVPAITCYSKEEFDAELVRMSAISKRIHIDLMDGEFAPHGDLSLQDISWPQGDGLQVDVHLMYQDPVSQFNTLTAAKPSLVVFHAEAQGELLQLIQALQKSGIKAGVSLMRSTVPADVAGLIGVADHVLIFSGNLGEHGGTANMLQIEKVRLIRAINPEVEIGWDGGANVSNVYTLSLGGIDVVNVGGALAQTDDLAEVYRRLDFEVHRKDIAKEKKKV
jgi:ribulose-phosphate 3-epimerase